MRGRSRLAACSSAFVVFLAATSTSAAADGCTAADALPGTAPEATLQAATICLVNVERKAAGRPRLATNPALRRTATVYARDMITTQQFGHTDPAGGSVSDRVFEVTGSLDAWLELGENLGWGSFEQAAPRAMVAGWMGSPTHRDNLLYEPFTRIGIGIVPGAPVAGRSDALTYVGVFGRTARRRASRCSRAHRKVRGARRCRAARRR